MADLRISALPQVSSQRQPVMDKVAAQRHDYGFQTASTSSELTGLVEGLSVLNPALRVKMQQDTQLAAAAANQQAQATAQAAQVSNTKEAQDLLGSPLPSSVPPAFDLAYRTGLKNVLADRAGANVKAEILTKYNEQKHLEGFDPAKFLSESRSSALAGWADPEMVNKIGDHVNGLEVAIRSDVEKTRFAAQQENVDASLAQVMADRLPSNVTTKELADIYTTDILPRFRAFGKSPKEAAGSLLSQLNSMSEKMGGAPHLFDVFDEPGPDGKTLSSYSAEMTGRVLAAKAQATSKLEAAMERASQGRTLEGLDTLDKDLAKDPSLITVERLKGMIGPHDIFPTAEAAHGYLNKARAAMGDRHGLQELDKHWDLREMSRLPEAAQKKLAERHLGPYMDRMYEMSRGTDVAGAATAANALVKALAYRNVSITLEPVAQFISSLSTTMPSKAGPDTAFKTRAELFKAMSGNPVMRSQYFKGDAADLMEHYTKMATAGNDPLEAYTSAYAAVSPEAKAAAVEMAKDPKFAKAAASAVNEVQGSSWIPSWAGGKDRPGNVDVIDASGRAAMRDHKNRFPNASLDDLKEVAKRSVAENWVHDSASKMAVRVPRGLATPAMQEALTSYSEKLIKEHRLTERNDADWRVEYVPEGTEGVMSVRMTDGMGRIKVVARKDLREMINDDYAAKNIIHGGPQDEGGRLTELKRQVSSGTVDPAFVAANQALIAKARQVEALPKATLRALDKMASDAALANIQSIPKMSFGKPDSSTLALPNRGSTVKPDAKLTAQIALRFASTGQMLDGTAHSGLAASLLTIGEGVMTQAYADPSAGAHKTIGVGYNIAANEKTVHADMKRAGVPESQIQNVIDGKAQMTPDQVVRLAQVAMPRYEKLATEAAEKTSPGLWLKMTPPQRAVMIDVAYQVGSVEQFRQAWKALASGDAEGFAEHAQTSFVNRDGVRVKDKRRNNLRAAMLAGGPRWHAEVSKYGSLPSNAIEVAALNQ